MTRSIVARTLAARFLDRLAATPRGRAFMLQFLVNAEEGDEAGVFDRLVEKVDDPALNKLVRRHRDDEYRHARVFRDCLARQGVAAERLPAPANVLPFIERALGGVGAAFVDDRRTVMEAYLMLQVVEERGVEQYPLIASSIERYDPESAAVIREVANDELRHVKYAIAISRRYAPDALTREATLRRFRAAEQRAFVEHGRVFLAQAVTADLLDVRGPERLVWRGLAALERQRSAAIPMAVAA